MFHIKRFQIIHDFYVLITHSRTFTSSSLSTLNPLKLHISYTDKHSVTFEYRIFIAIDLASCAFSLNKLHNIFNIFVLHAYFNLLISSVEGSFYSSIRVTFNSISLHSKRIVNEFICELHFL